MKIAVCLAALAGYQIGYNVANCGTVFWCGW